MTHKNVPSESSEGKYLLSSEPSKVDHYVNGSHKYAERSIFLLPDSSTSSHVGNSTKCAMIDHMEFEDELLQCGLCIKEHEMNIESLKFQLSKIKREISILEDFTYEKQLVMKRIVSQRGSAAAVICQFFQSSTWGEMKYDFVKNIIGVVAFLGSVQNDDLSRVLAEYLGKHQMLGIVCKSYAEASQLEMHEPDGSVNKAHGLHAFAAEHGLSINKQYLVFCLENIRPCRGKVCSDADRKLQLPDPILPNGKPPPGFLGYAVNMIDIDVQLREWRTASGHGLRETLFYHLFGELQVYKNSQYMTGAESCIRDDAVSLDGGIKRGNGVLSLGYWDEDIKFPVVPNPREMYERKQEQLRKTNDELMREQSGHGEELKKFRKLEDRWNSLLDEIQRSMGG